MVVIQVLHQERVRVVLQGNIQVQLHLVVFSVHRGNITVKQEDADVLPVVKESMH